MEYIVERPKYTHKRHQNQLQKHSNNVPQTEEEPINTIFDISNQHLKYVGQGEKGNSPTQKEKNINSTFTK